MSAGGRSPHLADRRRPPRALTLTPALVAVLAALLAGPAGSLELAGRVFVVSWIDLAGVALGLTGLGVAVRRRRVHLELALVGYAGVLAVALLQTLLRPQPLEILGGSSRFVTAALLLFGLSQLTAGHARAATRWDATAVLVGFGAVLGAWVLLRLGLALADPQLTTFYAVKNAVVVPLGASNTLAGYLLLPAVAGAVLATGQRRLLLPAACALLGVVATLSRGGLLALLASLLLGAVATRRRPVVALAAGATVVALSLTAALTLLVDRAPAPAESSEPAAATAATPDGTAITPAPTTGPAEGLTDRRLEGATVSSPEGRLALWRSSAGAFLDAPLLGVGLNRLPAVTAELAQPHDHAHNLLLHALAETGLVGTLAYLLLWVALARRLWLADPSPQRTALALGALALFLHAQVEALSSQRGIEALLAVLLAVAASLPEAAPRPAGRVPLHR